MTSFLERAVWRFEGSAGNKVRGIRLVVMALRPLSQLAVLSCPVPVLCGGGEYTVPQTDKTTAPFSHLGQDVMDGEKRQEREISPPAVAGLSICHASDSNALSPQACSNTC